MKKLVLDSWHRQIGAKMVAFAGFEMPIRYGSEIEEHRAVRQNVGIFDISHMGEFVVIGKYALDFLQKVTSNNVAKLYNGKVQYSCFLNENGGIVDDLLVYRLQENKYLLVVNAANIEKDWQHLMSYLPSDKEVILQNISDETCLFALQGPNAQNVLQPLVNVSLSNLAYYTFVVTEMAGIPDILISATGYTGAGGFEICVPNQYAETIWTKIIESGKRFHLQPIGLGARDTLRLEKGYCLYGNDIDETTSPLEAGLSWIVSFQKEFIGKETLLQQQRDGLQRKLVGFVMKEKAIPRAHYLICDSTGKSIGRVTSGSLSPTLGYGIGLGYVQKPFDEIGTQILIRIRNNFHQAQVCQLPFL
ncbi:MAG: glycine cleavage system aminomethyltransferase GcvT [Cytophagales bacterium]|nr:glycine cleavage system aminomethyltransferase GcvT [Cytophagales bacterium]MDW8384702.1 glycine cleavage system aminomethyltransferase GcvT [Flammeovirgaceae bacterium]